MKIVTNTPDEIVIKERPFWLSAFLLLFFVVIVYAIFVDWNDIEWPERALYVFLAFALAVAFSFLVKWVRVSFLRSLDRIEIVRRGVLDATRETYPLKSLTTVRVDEPRRAREYGKRIVLEFDEAVLNMLDVETRAIVDRRRTYMTFPDGRIDAPLTAYYSGVTNAAAVAETLNAWRGA